MGYLHFNDNGFYIFYCLINERGKHMFELTLLVVVLVLILILAAWDLGIHIIFDLIAVAAAWYFFTEHELIIAAVTLTVAAILKRLGTFITHRKSN